MVPPLPVLHRTECASLGGTLASVHSKEENDFVTGLVKPTRCDVNVAAVCHPPISFGRLAWLGAERVSGTAFQWEDDSPWDFGNWGPGKWQGGTRL